MSDSMFDGANLPTINIYTVITNYSQDISKNLLNFIPPSRSTIKDPGLVDGLVPTEGRRMLVRP